jgi:O-acetyl-ADP-ribose deacetylase (regulator of RNase III)
VPKPAFHRAILIVDVENFGDPARTNPCQLAVRAALYKALRAAFARARISWTACTAEDRGDGILVLIPPDVPKAWLVSRLPARLAEALDRHNQASPPPARIRLRMALHAGEVHQDTHGHAGTALNRAFRLIEAPAARAALRQSPGPLALIVSDWFYDEVVRHDPAAGPARFRPVPVTVKETEMPAWVCALVPPATRQADAARQDDGDSRIAVPETTVQLFQVPGVPGPLPRNVGIITGDLRQVRCAQVWVNPENTQMRMAPQEESSISSVIRYQGSLRDRAGHVVSDLIADELAQKAGRSPVAPGTAITTGAGKLARSHKVRHVIHVAAVQGQADTGYRQVHEVGRCVTYALAEAARLRDRGQPVSTILLPLLGTGHGSGDLGMTVPVLLNAAVDYLVSVPGTPVTTVYFLAYTYAELAACREAFRTDPRLVG